MLVLAFIIIIKIISLESSGKAHKVRITFSPQKVFERIKRDEEQQYLAQMLHTGVLRGNN